MVSIAFSARLRVSISPTSVARRPISTLSSTVSQGNSAKLWNTIATPSAGPSTGLPSSVTAPSVGRVRPEMSRSKVDLPQPERPSSATISPARKVSETSLRIGAPCSPEPLEKLWLTWATSSSGGRVTSSMARLSKAEAALGKGVEPAPEQPVEQSDDDRHDGDAEHDAREIALVGGFSDIGADAVRRHSLILPSHIFGDDRGVPRAAGGGDRAGEVIRRHAGQHHVAPPAPAADAQVRRRLSQVVGKRRRAADGVEDDVPLRAEDDEKAQPDVRVEMERQHQADRRAEQQIDGERRQE